MNKKNSAIELWRFIFIVAMAIGSLNNVIWAQKDVKLLFTGNSFLVFFMLLSGYFLMRHYQQNKDKEKKASVQAWNYTKERIASLYPALLGGVGLSFIVRNVINNVSLNTAFTNFMNSLWEFFGLSQLGGNSLVLWNEPLWYISALFIASFILYYLVSKNEDLFTFIAVLFIIFIYGSLGFNARGINIGFLSVSNNLVRLTATMMVGMLMYYLVDYFQKKKFTENLTMTFSVLHIAIAMFILYFLVHGTPWTNATYGIVLFIFTVILLVNKDYISALYNDSLTLNTLGRLSLYYYACHIAFVYLLAYLYPEMSYIPSIIFNILFSLSWSLIMLYVDEFVITPCFRTKKTNKEQQKSKTKKSK